MSLWVFLLPVPCSSSIKQCLFPFELFEHEKSRAFHELCDVMFKKHSDALYDKNIDRNQSVLCFYLWVSFFQKYVSRFLFSYVLVCGFLLH